MTNAQCLGALTMDAFPFPSSKMPVMRVIQFHDFLQYTTIAVSVYISVLYVLRQNVLNSGLQFSFQRSILPVEGRVGPSYYSPLEQDFEHPVYVTFVTRLSQLLYYMKAGDK